MSDNKISEHCDIKCFEHEHIKAEADAGLRKRGANT